MCRIRLEPERSVDQVCEACLEQPLQLLLELDPEAPLLAEASVDYDAAEVSADETQREDGYLGIKACDEVCICSHVYGGHGGNRYDSYVCCATSYQLAGHGVLLNIG